MVGNLSADGALELMIPASDVPALDRCLTQAMSGDDAAFGDVVAALHWPLRLWLAARCPPELDPDEVAQLAFVKAHAIIREYQPGTNPRAWIWTIARNQLRAQITDLRRKQVQTEQYLPEAVRQAIARGQDDQPQQDDGELAALQRCLDRLPVRTREVLNAFYRDDQPIEAIASVWQRSAGAVKKQLCLVRKGLRQCIEQRLAEGERV